MLLKTAGEPVSYLNDSSCTVQSNATKRTEDETGEPQDIIHSAPLQG